MNLNRDNMKKIMFLIAFTLVMAVCIFNMGTVLYYLNFLFVVAAPFIIGGAIAFIVNIPMKFIEQRLFYNKYIFKSKTAQKFARPVSILLAILFIIGIIAIALGIVLPDLGTTIVSVSNSITVFIPKLYTFVRKYIENEMVEEYIYKLQDLDWLSMLKETLNVFTTGAGSVISTTIGMISSVMSATFNIFIAFVFAIYILSQKETLSNQTKLTLKAFLKDKYYNKIIYVAELTNKTFTNFVSGQCLDAFILGVMFFIVLTIAGMPYQLLISVLVGITALIPVLGCYIGCIISAFLIFMISPIQCVIFLVIFVILQQIEGNLIYPKVVGGSVGLPSIWVLVAVTIGGSLWGVLGMIVFIPLFSVIYTLFKSYVQKKLGTKHNI